MQLDAGESRKSSLNDSADLDLCGKVAGTKSIFESPSPGGTMKKKSTPLKRESSTVTDLDGSLDVDPILSTPPPPSTVTVEEKKPEKKKKKNPFKKKKTKKIEVEEVPKEIEKVPSLPELSNIAYEERAVDVETITSLIESFADDDRKSNGSGPQIVYVPPSYAAEEMGKLQFTIYLILIDSSATMSLHKRFPPPDLMTVLYIRWVAPEHAL